MLVIIYSMTRKEISSYIDHTILLPEAGVKDVEQICNEARKYEFASVCVNPVYVPFAVSALQGTSVKVCTVVGFPLGANSTAAKALEAKDAIENGADEIDMVMNIGAAKDGRLSVVGSDIATVVQTCHEEGEKVGKKIIVKVILETCLLDDDTIVNCCLVAKKAGADFVKTSTGFATLKDIDGRLLPNGASEHHVSLMRKTVGPDMGVKASGGIKTPNMVAMMIKAGANRIGTSSGARIVENWKEDLL